jgi:hypothetical protein
MYFIDIYFKILGCLLTKIETREGEEKLAYFNEHFNIPQTAKLMRPHILGDDLFEELKNDHGVSETVVALLDLQS